MNENLLKWLNNNIPPDKFIYKGYAIEQFNFYISDIPYYLSCSVNEMYKLKNARVISTYSSNSITLPIVMYNMDDLELNFIIGGDLYRYYVSIMSKNSVIIDVYDYMKEYIVNSSYFFGFKCSQIFEKYDPIINNSNFSFSCNSKYIMFMFLYNVVHYLRNK